MRRLRIGKWELRLARADHWDQCVDMEIDFSHYLRGEVRAILERHGCCHGHKIASTPPMFYPEAICCALAFQRKEGGRLQRLRRALEAVAKFSLSRPEPERGTPDD